MTHNNLEFGIRNLGCVFHTITVQAFGFTHTMSSLVMASACGLGVLCVLCDGPAGLPRIPNPNSECLILNRAQLLQQRHRVGMDQCDGTLEPERVGAGRNGGTSSA